MRVACLKPFAGLCLKRFSCVLLVALGGLLVVPGNAWSQEEKPADAPAAELATTGSLAVSGSFNGASILLDGEDTGKRTPAVLTGLAPGGHVVVARSRCLGARAKVTVEAGVETPVDMKMVQGKGRLKISTHPRQALITVDGVAIGNAPLVSNPLSCGEHVVEASSIGHESVSRIVDLPAFTKRRIHLTLQPMPPGAIAEALVGATATVEKASPDDAAAPADTAEASADTAAAAEAPEAAEAPADAAAPAESPEVAEAPEAAEAPADTAAPAESPEVAEAPEAAEASADTAEAPEVVEAPADTAEAPADTTVTPDAPAEATTEDAAPASAEGAAVAPETSEVSAPAVPAEPTATTTQVTIKGAADSGGLSQARAYGAGSVVLGAGLVLGGSLQHRKAKEAFFRFLDEPNDNIAILIYNEEVVPPKRLRIVGWGGGAVALATGTFLFVREDVALMPGPGGLVVSGRW